MSTIIDAAVNDVRLQREAIPLYEVEWRSLEEIGYTLGIGRKRLVRLLKSGLGEDHYIALAKGRQNGGHGSKGPHKRHPPSIKAKPSPVEVDEFDKPENEVPTGCCVRCGTPFVEVAYPAPPVAGICGGCQVLDAWLEERRNDESSIECVAQGRFGEHAEQSATDGAAGGSGWLLRDGPGCDA